MDLVLDRAAIAEVEDFDGSTQLDASGNLAI
jgi:hypothetical protein